MEAPHSAQPAIELGLQGRLQIAQGIADCLRGERVERGRAALCAYARSGLECSHWCEPLRVTPVVALLSANWSSLASQPFATCLHIGNGNL